MADNGITLFNGKLKWIAVIAATAVLSLFSWMLYHINQLDRDSVGYSYNITALSEAGRAQALLNLSMQGNVSALQNTTGLLDNRITTTNKELDNERQSTNDSLKELKQELTGVDDKLTQILIRLGVPKK